MEIHELILKMNNINNEHQTRMMKINGRYKVVVAFLWFLFAASIALPFVQVWLIDNGTVKCELNKVEQ